MPKKNKAKPAQPQTRVQATESDVLVPARWEAELGSAGKAKGKAVEQWEELFRFLNFRVMALKRERAQARPMQPETKERIFNAVLELFTFLGFPTLPNARDQLLAMLRIEERESEELAFSAILTGILAGLMLVVERHLDTSEEPTPEEVEKMLTALKELRYEMRDILKKSVAKLVKAMPHDPGGHPRLLTEEQSAQVCHDIAELHERGLPKAEAFKRLARKYKTSRRTIQRTWHERPRSDFPTGRSSE